MLSLYWKIFLSFWLTTILIIFTTVLVTHAHFIIVSWAGLCLRLSYAIFISGIICYFLSNYLTKPLQAVKLAADSIAKGKFNTRVGYCKGHKKDEIAALSIAFDSMAEELETMITSKERLLQDISHELRSPLARLQIAMELARKKSPPPTVPLFSRMETECDRLNKLIGEIVQFTRMNASSDKIQKTNIDIMALLQEICVDANFEFGQMQRVRLEPHPPLFLSINKKLMHRAIENIVRNALYYSPPSTLVIIQVSLQPESESIAICISDEGPGIPDNELKKIFNPFYRVDSSREKRTGGFGLGLSIAERAVFLHEGSITAANHTPRGLAIRIFLPQLSLPKG